MSELDFFGYAATAFILLGTFISIDKDYYGWALRIFGSLVWAYVGVRIGMMSLWVSESIFALVALYGYQQWKAQDKLERLRSLTEELANWQMAGMNGWRVVEQELDKPYEPVIFGDPVEEKNETKQLQSKRARVAKKSSRTSKKKIRSARGRRSKSANGKPRSRPNAKPKGTKRSKGNI